MHLDISVSTCKQVSCQLCVVGGVGGGGQSKGCTGTWEKALQLFCLLLLLSSFYSQQSDHFLQYKWSEDMPEFEKTFNNLSTLSEKDLISFCTACKFQWLWNEVSNFSLGFFSHIGPSSVLFTMVFPWWSSFLSFNSQTKYHCFRETLFDPLNLKLDTLISSHCPHQYLSHPAALGRVCHNF